MTAYYGEEGMVPYLQCETMARDLYFTSKLCLIKYELDIHVNCFFNPRKAVGTKSIHPLEKGVRGKGFKGYLYLNFSWPAH